MGQIADGRQGTRKALLILLVLVVPVVIALAIIGARDLCIVVFRDRARLRRIAGGDHEYRLMGWEGDVTVVVAGSREGERSWHFFWDEMNVATVTEMENGDLEVSACKGTARAEEAYVAASRETGEIVSLTVVLPETEHSRRIEKVLKDLDFDGRWDVRLQDGPSIWYEGEWRPAQKQEDDTWAVRIRDAWAEVTLQDGRWQLHDR